MSEYKKVHFGPNKTKTFLDDKGFLHFQLEESLSDYPNRFTDRLQHFAEVTPKQAFCLKKIRKIGIH